MQRRLRRWGVFAARSDELVLPPSTLAPVAFQPDRGVDSKVVPESPKRSVGTLPAAESSVVRSDGVDPVPPAIEPR